MNIKKELLLIEAHSAYIKLMLGDLPLEKINEYVVDDVMGYGTAADEKIFGIDALLSLGKMQREQAEGLQVNFKITPVFHRIGANEQTAIFVDEIFTTMLLNEEKHEIQLRTSTFFEFNNDAWKVTHLHVSTPVATENDTWHKEEWKRKNEELQKLVDEKTSALKISLEDLKSTQKQLIHSEKMASLGELTAGIAHEIQNPLNFINNFSETNIELIDEMQQEIDKENFDEVKAIANDVKQNEQKIVHHGRRADTIVKNMLQHSRPNAGDKEKVDLNALVDECLRLSYHGYRAKDKNFNAKLETQFNQVDKVMAVPQEISRVLINLFNNALYSVNEKKKQLNGTFEPTVFVGTYQNIGKAEVMIKDNGLGISAGVIDKIYQPFFTTKPSGEGTGLGLSLSYDIIKAHGGELKVNTKEGEFAEFTLILRTH